MAVEKTYKCENEECDQYEHIVVCNIGANDHIGPCECCGGEMTRIFVTPVAISFNGKWFANTGSY